MTNLSVSEGVLIAMPYEFVDAHLPAWWQKTMAPWLESHGHHQPSSLVKTAAPGSYLQTNTLSRGDTYAITVLLEPRGASTHVTFSAAVIPAPGQRAVGRTATKVLGRVMHWEFRTLAKDFRRYVEGLSGESAREVA
jgi:hypothetical protein